MRRIDMPALATKRPSKVRTTVRLPRSLYNDARLFVDKNPVTAESLNDFLVAAVVSYVKLLKRRQIDAAFSAVAEDADYQKEARLIAEEFSQSDWEALELDENSSAKA
jgi:hypothetical protein